MSRSHANEPRTWKARLRRRLRWFLYDFIPPEVAVSAADRDRITRVVRRTPPQMSGPGARLRIAIMAVTLIAIAVVIAIWARPFFLLMAPALLLCLHIFTLTLCAEDRSRQTYALLRDAGYDVCPTCGQWLAPLPEQTAKCPECGWARET